MKEPVVEHNLEIHEETPQTVLQPPVVHENTSVVPSRNSTPHFFIDLRIDPTPSQIDPTPSKVDQTPSQTSLEPSNHEIKWTRNHLIQ